MFFAWNITIPAATPDSAPIKQELPLILGMIKSIDIKFPAGCHGLVKVRIKRYDSQLLPLSTAEYMTGDDETIPALVFYKLTTGIASVTFEGSSPNTTYAHVVTIRISIEPEITDFEQSVIKLLTQISIALDTTYEFGEPVPITPIIPSPLIPALQLISAREILRETVTVRAVR